MKQLMQAMGSRAVQQCWDAVPRYMNHHDFDYDEAFDEASCGLREFATKSVPACSSESAG